MRWPGVTTAPTATSSMIVNDRALRCLTPWRLDPWRLDPCAARARSETRCSERLTPRRHRGVQLQSWAVHRAVGSTTPHVEPAVGTHAEWESARPLPAR